MKKGAIWSFIFGLELAIALAASFALRTFVIAHDGEGLPRDTQIHGNAAAPPELAFACELADEPLQSLFSKPDVMDDLRQLNAGISLSLMDLSDARAGVVRKLNEARIPVTAWMALPKEQGYYLNATNAPGAAARFAAFEKWSSDYRLQWAGVGLDIEPNLGEFEAVRRGRAWQSAAAIIRRCFDIGGVKRAASAYAALIRRMQADGYRVETYQFPFIADERKAHSHLLERLAGIVDVRGDREVFMTYTSFNHTIDSALIRAYGPEAQVIVVGSTAGDPQADARFRPLNWDEFSRDLIVASHFSPVVGVYSLEGCIRQGFLGRLKTMRWGQSVTIPAEASGKILRFRRRIQASLWTGSHLPYFVVVLALLNGGLLWRRRGKPARVRG